MGNFSLVTNGNFDTALGNVPAPWAPITRVGNVADVSPNSHLPVEVSAFSATVTGYVSYDTLNEPTLLEAWLEDTFGVDYLMYKIGLAIRVIDENIKNIAPPLTTVPEEQQILKSLLLIPTLIGTLPWKATTEYDASLKLTVDFAGTPAGATLNVVEDIDGEYYLKLWDWGNGTVTVGTATSKVYAVDGTYDVRLIVIGAGGIVEKRRSFVIDVP